MPKYEPHPAADAFPLMTGEEFDALCSDIQEHGLREPIILYQGRILDGRNRYRACQRLGIEPSFREWGNGMSPEAYVVSANIMRRHLTPSQRAMIAASLLKVAQPTTTEIYNKNSELTAEEAADITHVHRSTVFDAKRVLDDGNPEEIAAVVAGRSGVGPVADGIRKRTKKKKTSQKRNLNNSGKNPERLENMRMEAQVWAHLKDGLVGLTSLPTVSDVAVIVRKNPQRIAEVNRRLDAAAEWISSFKEIWNERNGSVDA